MVLINRPRVVESVEKWHSYARLYSRFSTVYPSSSRVSTRTFKRLVLTQIHLFSLGQLSNLALKFVELNGEVAVDAPAVLDLFQGMHNR